MSCLPHVLSTAHQRGEDLVVVLAATKVAGDSVREQRARRVWVRLEEAHRGLDEARHAERALEALLVAPALRASASELGAGQPQLVAECRGQSFLLQHVDATLLAIDRERDQTLDTARCRGLLAEHRRGAPEVCGR